MSEKAPIIPEKKDEHGYVEHQQIRKSMNLDQIFEEKKEGKVTIQDLKKVKKMMNDFNMKRTDLLHQYNQDIIRQLK